MRVQFSNSTILDEWWLSCELVLAEIYNIFLKITISSRLENVNLPQQIPAAVVASFYLNFQVFFHMNSAEFHINRRLFTIFYRTPIHLSNSCQTEESMYCVVSYAIHWLIDGTLWMTWSMNVYLKCVSKRWTRLEICNQRWQQTNFEKKGIYSCIFPLTTWILIEHTFLSFGIELLSQKLYINLL